MKLKNLLLLLFSVTFIQLTAQQVEREEVLLEIGKSTTCYYCPGAEMGVEDLIENGHDVAAINYHIDDEYENNASISRYNYYNMTATPTAEFDGTEEVAGGDHSNSMYNAYLPHYQNRIAVPSSFTISIIADDENMTDFDIEVNLEKVSDSDAENIKLRSAVTESNIEDYWQGMSEVNYVERLMAPDHNGTTVNFSENDSQTVNLSFSLEDEWVTDNCELVVFLQDDNSKEVLQAVKFPINQMPGLNDYDLLLEDVRNIPENDCMGQIAPVIDVTNFGSETITGFNIEYSVNDETFTHEWEGSIATNEVATVELPEVSYNVQSQNTVEVTVTDPNGNPDGDTGNNTQTEDFEEAPNTHPTAELLLRTDNNPEETTWEIINSSGEVVHSGGPYESPNSWVETNTELPVAPEDCYKFVVYDSGGNGFANGSGSCELESSDGIMICDIEESHDFGSQHNKQYHAAYGTGILNPDTPSSLSVYPNPANSFVNIELGLKTESRVEINVFNTLGEQVYQKSYGQLSAGTNSLGISTEDLKSGVYLIRLQAGNKEYKHRMVVE